MTTEKTKPDFSVTTCTEIRTGGGQLIKVRCNPDDVAKITEALQLAHSFDKPLTKPLKNTQSTKLGQGPIGHYTRFDILRHRYGGGGYPGNGAYVEVLEIKDAPDGRHPFVIYHRAENYSWSWPKVEASFTEWENLDQAISALENNSREISTGGDCTKIPGFIRRVECGLLIPWFLAIGDQALIGDYAFPEHLQNDPYFRFGGKFVVREDRDSPPKIKICLGNCKFEDGKGDTRRTVYWDDGSVWREDIGPRPTALSEHDEWIADVTSHFQQMLAGDKKEFSINFLDGSKFSGRIILPKDKDTSPAGDYLLVATLRQNGKENVKEGWVNNFEPTPEFPSIIDYVTAKFLENGLEVVKIEIQKKKVKRGGRKWHGVFHSPPD